MHPDAGHADAPPRASPARAPRRRLPRARTRGLGHAGHRHLGRADRAHVRARPAGRAAGRVAGCPPRRPSCSGSASFATTRSAARWCRPRAWRARHSSRGGACTTTACPSRHWTARIRRRRPPSRAGAASTGGRSAERGWVDGPQAQSQVHAVAAAPGLEIVGFDRLTPLQEALLARWAATGLEVRRVPSEAARGSAERVGRVSCLDAAAEIEAAARWAAARLDGRRRSPHRDRRAGPRPAPRRRCGASSSACWCRRPGWPVDPVPESQAFELAAARPLAEQPAVAAALDLLEAFVRPPDLAALSRLLRNAYVAGAAGGGRGPGAARCEASAGSKARASGCRPSRGSPPSGTVRRWRRRWRRGRPCCRVWPEKELPSNCSKYIFSLLTAVGWPGPGADGTEYQAEQRWRSLVSRVRRLRRVHRPRVACRGRGPAAGHGQGGCCSSRRNCVRRCS